MRIVFFASVVWLAAFVLLPSGFDTCLEGFSASTCVHTLR